MKESTTDAITTSVIWQGNWDPGFSVHIPWPINKDVSVQAHASVRVLLENGDYYLELTLNGTSRRFALTQACYPAFSVGPATLEVCAEPALENNHLTGLRLTVKVCIALDVGPVHVKKCFDVFNDTIHFVRLSWAEAAAIAGVSCPRDYPSDDKSPGALIAIVGVEVS